LESENVPFQAFISQAAILIFLLGRSSSAPPATLSWFISSEMYFRKFPSCRNSIEFLNFLGFSSCRGNEGHGFFIARAKFSAIAEVMEQRIRGDIQAFDNDQLRN
jgi:hypothetical protein